MREKESELEGRVVLSAGRPGEREREPFLNGTAEKLLAESLFRADRDGYKKTAFK